MKSHQAKLEISYGLQWVGLLCRGSMQHWKQSVRVCQAVRCAAIEDLRELFSRPGGCGSLYRRISCSTGYWHCQLASKMIFAWGTHLSNQGFKLRPFNRVWVPQTSKSLYFACSWQQTCSLRWKCWSSSHMSPAISLAGQSIKCLLGRKWFIHLKKLWLCSWLYIMKM